MGIGQGVGAPENRRTAPPKNSYPTNTTHLKGAVGAISKFTHPPTHQLLNTHHQMSGIITLPTKRGTHHPPNWAPPTTLLQERMGRITHHPNCSFNKVTGVNKQCWWQEGQNAHNEEEGNNEWNNVTSLTYRHTVTWTHLLPHMGMAMFNNVTNNLARHCHCH